GSRPAPSAGEIHGPGPPPQGGREGAGARAAREEGPAGGDPSRTLARTLLGVFAALEPDPKRSRLDPRPMAERKTDPPGKTTKKLKPEQYELKIRWEKARQVLEVSPTGVRFDFDTPLKVGTRYPISLTAPGVSLSTTPEVSGCQL